MRLNRNVWNPGRRTLALIVTVPLVAAGILVVSGAGPAAADTGNYPYWKMPCELSPYNTVGYCNAVSGPYDWGPVKNGSATSQISLYGYGYRNCTDYVAWRVASLDVQSAQYRGLGNADTWGKRAAAHGLVDDTRPAVGSVAVSTAGSFGHVAFVTAVSGSQITVSQYNKAGTGAYSTQTGTAVSLGFSSFVHFEKFESGGTGSAGPVQLLTSVVDPGSGRNIFYVATNGTVNQFYVSGGHWVNTQLGGQVMPGTGLTSVVDPGSGRNIFYVATNGTVNQFYVSGGHWVNTQLGGQVMPGTGLTSVVDPGSGRNIFYVATNGTVNQFYVSGGHWVNTQLGGQVMPGTGLTSVVDPGSGRNIFYVATNGTVNQFYVSGGHWVNTQLGGQVMPGTGLTSVVDPGSGRNIFYVATNGTVNQFYVSGGHWVNTQLGGQVMPGTGLTSVVDPGSGRNIFYVATNGTVNQFYVSGGHWVNTQLGGTAEKP